MRNDAEKVDSRLRGNDGQGSARRRRRRSVAARASPIRQKVNLLADWHEENFEVRRTPCLAASCAIVNSPRIASSATLVLKSAEYRFRYPAVTLILRSGRTLTKLSDLQGPALGRFGPQEYLQ